jgi:magnesium chelatase subunit I
MNQKVPLKGLRPVFPFTAIIGQDEMKLSLMLNIIDPRIGGVMIMGDRGTENLQQYELLLIYCQK